jgi:hypothetical protein
MARHLPGNDGDQPLTPSPDRRTIGVLVVYLAARIVPLCAAGFLFGYVRASGRYAFLLP